MREGLLRSRELETTMRRGDCEDMPVGRGATTEVERRSVRAVSGLPDFLKVLEGPVHKAAAISEQGKDETRPPGRVPIFG